MTELDKLAQEYEDITQTLEKHQQARHVLEERRKNILNGLQRVSGSIWNEYTLANRQHGQLTVLRHRWVYQKMAELGLGVCSAEVIPWRFATKHNQMEGLSKAEKLGIFHQGSLRYLLINKREYFSGGDYESDTYFEVDYIARLCPHHFPHPEKPIFAGSYVFKLFERGMFEVTFDKDGEFVYIGSGQKLDRNKLHIDDATGLYPQMPLPENIFQHFQIPALPERPKVPGG